MTRLVGVIHNKFNLRMNRVGVEESLPRTDREELETERQLFEGFGAMQRLSMLHITDLNALTNNIGQL